MSIRQPICQVIWASQSDIKAVGHARHSPLTRPHVHSPRLSPYLPVPAPVPLPGLCAAIHGPHHSRPSNCRSQIKRFRQAVNPLTMKLFSAYDIRPRRTLTATMASAWHQQHITICWQAGDKICLVPFPSNIELYRICIYSMQVGSAAQMKK